MTCVSVANACKYESVFVGDFEKGVDFVLLVFEGTGSYARVSTSKVLLTRAGSAVKGTVDRVDVLICPQVLPGSWGEVMGSLY